MEKVTLIFKVTPAIIKDSKASAKATALASVVPSNILLTAELFLGHQSQHEVGFLILIVPCPNLTILSYIRGFPIFKLNSLTNLSDLLD